mmetsp:Transcript_38765/g.75835  ORF Transcript_38765/g.75835 Transcript_38765/m.75835 type:complete len:226 (+) Transcript_38765:390-1067(+)
MTVKTSVRNFLNSFSSANCGWYRAVQCSLNCSASASLMLMRGTPSRYAINLQTFSACSGTILSPRCPPYATLNPNPLGFSTTLAPHANTHSSMPSSSEMAQPNVRAIAHAMLMLRLMLLLEAEEPESSAKAAATRGRKRRQGSRALSSSTLSSVSSFLLAAAVVLARMPFPASTSASHSAPSFSSSSKITKRPPRSSSACSAWSSGASCESLGCSFVRSLKSSRE